MDEQGETEGGVSLIISAEQLEPFIVGGAKSSLWAQTLCFFVFVFVFVFNSGRHFLRRTLDMMIMLVSKLI